MKEEIKKKIEAFVDQDVLTWWDWKRVEEFRVELKKVLPSDVVDSFIEDAQSAAEVRSDRDQGSASANELEDAIESLYETVERILGHVAA